VSGDAMMSSDAMQSSDATSVDQRRFDDSADAKTCFAPSECTAGQVCCFTLNTADFTGVINCQASAACASDGVSTFIVCATADDCPATRPACVNIAVGSPALFICE